MGLLSGFLVGAKATNVSLKRQNLKNYLARDYRVCGLKNVVFCCSALVILLDSSEEGNGIFNVLFFRKGLPSNIKVFFETNSFTISIIPQSTTYLVR